MLVFASHFPYFTTSSDTLFKSISGEFSVGESLVGHLAYPVSRNGSTKSVSIIVISFIVLGNCVLVVLYFNKK